MLMTTKVMNATHRPIPSLSRPSVLQRSRQQRPQMRTRSADFPAFASGFGAVASKQSGDGQSAVPPTCSRQGGGLRCGVGVLSLAERPGASRLQICDTADYKSALRNPRSFTDGTVGWTTVRSPSPRPSPLGKGRMVHSLSIKPLPEFAQRPSAKHQSDACCSLSLRERVRVRDKCSVEHAKSGRSGRLLSIGLCLFLDLAVLPLITQAQFTGGPPVINQQPRSQIVAAGTAVTFRVSVAQSYTPVRYQWQSFGYEVTGATNSTLVISNATLRAGGGYAVVVATA